MKNILYTIGLFSITIFALSVLMDKPMEILDFTNQQEIKEENKQEVVIEKGYLNGVFVATVFNLDFPTTVGQSEDRLKSEIDAIIYNCKQEEITDIFFQVRPSADAFYESEIFPPSIYVTGSQDTELPFDILEYFVEMAHFEGMKLHAWINPYRVTKLDTEVLSDENPAVTNPEMVVLHTDGNLYFDPANLDAQQLIVDGVLEIITNYDVDGIHFDDYFYPDTKFDDSKSYEEYGNGQELGDFRRENVTKLIQMVSYVIEENAPDVLFGISPFGIWANEKNLELGSDTHGLESYFSHYADTKLWVEMEIIDYIAPQIYWAMDFSIANYVTLVDWWLDVTNDYDVELYISHANYQEVLGNFNDGEIANQIQYNIDNGVQGSIYFRYEHLTGLN